MSPVLAILIYLAVATFVVTRRGLVSSEFVFLVFLSLFHIPFTIIYLLDFGSFEKLNILSLINIDTELLTLVPLDIATIVVGVYAGSSLQTTFRRQKTTRYERAAQFQPVFVLFFLGTMIIVTMRLLYVRSVGYHEAGNFALVDPVIDWLIRGFYLVLFAYVMEINKWQISPRHWILFLPFIVALIGGSRQAALGPIVAVAVLNSIMLNSSTSRYLRISVVFGAIALAFPLIRNSRVTEGENLNWNSFDGLLGILIETGRTVRLVQWSRDTCTEPIGISAYLLEALGRLVPFTQKNIQNLSTEVWGGGNGFSALAEAYCVAGDIKILWLLLLGALWGYFLGFRRSDLSTPQGRLKVFLTISLAITWPRDELLGYVRELVWVSFLIPLLVNAFFVRRFRYASKTEDRASPDSPTRGHAL